MLSTWPKDGHMLSVLSWHVYAPPSLFMQLGSFRIQIDSLTCLVFRCPSLSNILAPDHDMIFFRYMICYGRLVHFCCPALSIWPCERSVAYRFYFSVFLALVSSHNFWQSLQYMYSRSCGMESCTHILQFALLWVDLLGGLAAVSVSCMASWPYYSN